MSLINIADRPIQCSVHCALFLYTPAYSARIDGGPVISLAVVLVFSFSASLGSRRFRS